MPPTTTVSAGAVVQLGGSSGIVRTLLIMSGACAADHTWDVLVSPWHLNDHIEGFPVPADAIALAGPPEPDPSELNRLIDRFRDVADAVAQANRPLVLAGDCLTALGLVAGLQRRHHDVSVIWLDAHGDFNTPAISASGYLAGMSLAMLSGRAPEPMCEPLGLRPVPDEHAVLIGARDLDPAERDALEASRVLRLPADPGAVRSAVTQLSADDVYLHIDVDIIDAEDLPGLSPDPPTRRVEARETGSAGPLTRLLTSSAASVAAPGRVGRFRRAPWGVPRACRAAPSARVVC